MSAANRRARKRGRRPGRVFVRRFWRRPRFDLCADREVKPMWNRHAGSVAAAGAMTRRQLLKSAHAGFGYLAFAGLLGQNAPRASAAPGPLAPRAPHVPVKAKRIIFLFM